MAAKRLEPWSIKSRQGVDCLRSDPHYGHFIRLQVDKLIADVLKVDPASLYLPARGTRTVMFARHVAAYLAVVEGGLSQSACGRLFDRDRRAIAYAIARIEQRRDDEPGLDTTLDQLAERLRQALARMPVDLN